MWRLPFSFWKSKHLKASCTLTPDQPRGHYEKPSSLHKRSLFQNWRWVPGRSKDFLDNSSVKNSEFELLTSNHKELTIECIKCEKRLSSNRSLKRHTTNVHEPEKSYESRIECKKCGNNLHTDSIRRQMTNVHNENTDESLSECKKLQTEWIPTHSGKSQTHARVRSHRYFSVIFALPFALFFALYFAICKYLRLFLR